MTTLDELHERLRVAAAILDTAAGDIRNVNLAPTKDNIRHIGQALASIFDVMLAVYAVRPDLTPAALEPERGSEANKRLTVAFGRAITLADSGHISAAIDVLSSYAASETSSIHQRIALEEIERLRSREDDGRNDEGP